MRIKGIPGTFLDPRTKLIHFAPTGKYDLGGGHSAMTYTAKIHDGYLGLMVSRDPCEEGFLWHLSMSHRSTWDQRGGEVFTRYPSWDELKLAKFRFIPEEVVMAILFPSHGQKYVNDHETCLHLWEVPRELAD